VTRVKFRVGSIVYVAFTRDETTMGFGYPREERDALIVGDRGVQHRQGACLPALDPPTVPGYGQTASR
jgi:hypothetical protein